MGPGAVGFYQYTTARVKKLWGGVGIDKLKNALVSLKEFIYNSPTA
jgi:hypothetical protein